jgi:hypothetical protein
VLRADESRAEHGGHPGSNQQLSTPQRPAEDQCYYYILAVDELEKFLISLCGDDGEAINKDVNKARSESEIKKYISNRPGLLLFRFASVGAGAPPKEFEHTELWDGAKTCSAT